MSEPEIWLFVRAACLRQTNSSSAHSLLLLLYFEVFFVAVVSLPGRVRKRERERADAKKRGCSAISWHRFSDDTHALPSSFFLHRFYFFSFLLVFYFIINIYLHRRRHRRCCHWIFFEGRKDEDATAGVFTSFFLILFCLKISWCSPSSCVFQHRSPFPDLKRTLVLILCLSLRGFSVALVCRDGDGSSLCAHR